MESTRSAPGRAERVGNLLAAFDAGRLAVMRRLPMVSQK
jgi:hypothetical protein